MPFDPDIAHRLGKLERCLHQVCLYPGISVTGTPVNATLSLDELLLLISLLETNSVQDAAEIESLHTKTNQQAAAISALQIKAEQLDSASLT